jgi:hypothetical protein
MSIIKSVLFVWPLISLIFFYSFINFIFVNKVLMYILPITLELAHISLKSLANLASDFINHYFFLVSDFIMLFPDWSRLASRQTLVMSSLL